MPTRRSKLAYAFLSGRFTQVVQPARDYRLVLPTIEIGLAFLTRSSRNLYLGSGPKYIVFHSVIHHARFDNKSSTCFLYAILTFLHKFLFYIRCSVFILYTFYSHAFNKYVYTCAKCSVNITYVYSASVWSSAFVFVSRLSLLSIANKNFNYYIIYIYNLLFFC